jgi:Ca2+-binding EF-hand superfamily protein
VQNSEFFYISSESVNNFSVVFLPPINFLHKQADADGNGTIDYDEFITATMHMNRMDREEHLYTAFQHFDKDNSG